MNHLQRRALLKFSTVLTRLLIHIEPRWDLVRLGSLYGGWWVPLSALSAESVCYSAGVGEDITFDLALIASTGCNVWGFDPTPRARDHVSLVDNPRFHFVPVGVFGADGILRFYAPLDPAHVSHSVTNAQATDSYFEAECLKVRTLMRRQSHDRLDLLKLDIEGAEVSVLEDLLAQGPLPTVLCLELDQPEMPWRTVARVRKILHAGYCCLWMEGRNMTFLRG